MVVEPHRRAIRYAVEVGVPIAAGTDSSGRLYEEAGMLVEAGMPNAWTLWAATGDAALVLGVESDTGTIAEGKAADLLLLGRNLLESIGAMRGVAMVVCGGQAV